MRGAYIARLNLEEDHLLGVAAKIRAQVAVLGGVAAGMDLYYLHDNEARKNGRLLHRWGKTRFWRRIAYYFLFYPYLSGHVSDVGFIYIRYQGCSPLFLHMLRRLKKRNPGLVVLVEIPSFPYDAERTSYRERLLGAIDRSFRQRLHRYVDRMVTFSDEPEIFGVPTIRTDNGVDLEQIPVADGNPEAGRFCLIGVANLAFWHGYDRIIRGLARYYRDGGRREVLFSMVGTGNEKQNLEKLAIEENVANKVEFLGARYAEDLQQLFRRSHMAVSSIGMHRIATRTSNLKSREYCARGIPFVLGYDDPDFSDDFLFSYRVTATDEPVDIEGLLAFHDRLCSAHSRYRQEMRSYAEEHLGWDNKMAPVIRVLKQSVREQA
jgi:glycosyltransferase involved in cell wall biosynthesis